MEKLAELTYEDVPFFSFAGLKTWGKLAHIIDGDTAHFIMLDKEGTPMKLDCRLHGIDTPEMSKTPDLARKARNRLLQLATNCDVQLDDDHDKSEINNLIDLMNTKLLYIECFGNDKYGRQLVILYDDEGKSMCVNSLMIQEGFAHPYDGGKKLEWKIA